MHRYKELKRLGLLSFIKYDIEYEIMMQKSENVEKKDKVKKDENKLMQLNRGKRSSLGTFTQNKSLSPESRLGPKSPLSISPAKKIKTWTYNIRLKNPES